MLPRAARRFDQVLVKFIVAMLVAIDAGEFTPVVLIVEFVGKESEAVILFVPPANKDSKAGVRSNPALAWAVGVVAPPEFKAAG